MSNETKTQFLAVAVLEGVFFLAAIVTNVLIQPFVVRFGEYHNTAALSWIVLFALVLAVFIGVIAIRARKCAADALVLTNTLRYGIPGFLILAALGGMFGEYQSRADARFQLTRSLEGPLDHFDAFLSRQSFDSSTEWIGDILRF